MILLKRIYRFTVVILIILLLNTCNKDENESMSCSNTYIVAEDSLNVCNEVVKIDTILVTKNYESPHASDHNYFDLDINNDKLIDLQFSTYYNESTEGWAVEFGCNIHQIDSSLEFLIGANKNYLAIRNINDTIGLSDIWESKDMIKLSYGYFENCPPICPGLIVQINRDLQNKYIGFRIKEQSLINYFWISFDIKCFNTITLKEIGRTRNN